MRSRLEFEELLSSGDSLMGQHVEIKGFIIVENKRCYLLKDEEASEYSAKIEIYAPGLEKKIRETPTGPSANVGGTATYFGYAIISGVLYEPTVIMYKFSISDIETIIFFHGDGTYRFDFGQNSRIGQ